MPEKTIEYYMRLPYRVDIYPEDDGFTAVVPDLPGCMTCADSLDEVWEMIEEAKELWLQVALEDGSYIPEPAPVETEEYSGKFIVRLPKSLHRQISQRAQAEGTSLNQLVLSMLAENMGGWAARSNRLSASLHIKITKPFQPAQFEDIISKLKFSKPEPDMYTWPINMPLEQVPTMRSK